jgi:hypothetical protein
MGVTEDVAAGEPGGFPRHAHPQPVSGLEATER